MPGGKGLPTYTRNVRDATIEKRTTKYSKKREGNKYAFFPKQMDGPQFT